MLTGVVKMNVRLLDLSAANTGAHQPVVYVVPHGRGIMKHMGKVMPHGHRDLLTCFSYHDGGLNTRF